MHFADRVLEVCREKNSRLVVGLDPHWALIPDSAKRSPSEGGVLETLSSFLGGAVDACLPHAAAFKPQIAFFEQFGLDGLRALTRVLDRIRKGGGLVIMDAKRNDIGSTAQAYARAFFGAPDHAPPFPSDGLTLNAFLGYDGVAPFVENPEKGVFVLVKTSNPSSGKFQDLALEGGGTVSTAVADSVRSWNEKTLGQSGYGNIGAVIGATYPDHMRSLRVRMPQSLILVPGYGAQGGAEDAVRAAFNPDGLGALVNSSRGILFPPDWDAKGFAAVEDAAVQAKRNINRLASQPD